MNTSLSSSYLLKPSSTEPTSPSKQTHLKSLSYSSKTARQSPYIQAMPSTTVKALISPPHSKARFVSFKDIHGHGSHIPIVSEEASVRDSSPGSRTNTMIGSPNSSKKRDEVSFSPKKKISLPQLNNRLAHKETHSPETVRTEASEDGHVSHRTNLTSWDAATFADYNKQAEFLNTSPHFTKFSKLSHVLSKIEAKKSSLSKELFYYPEQVEANKKLAVQASLILKNRDEDGEIGIITITENTRHEVNLLEGRNTYFKLNCQNKVFPLRVRAEVYTGSFEIRVSKSKKKPGLGQYDHLFSVPSFDINYENPQSVKYLYFGIHALERLRLNFGVSFAMKPREPISLAPLKFDPERHRRKHGAYEFFSKDMRPEEVENLRRIAEDIREEKQQKALAMTHNIDITQINQTLAGKYHMVKPEQLAKLAAKRDMRTQMTQQNKEYHIIERQKKMLCESYRSDLMKIKIKWEAEEQERKKSLNDMQKIFSVIITFFSISKEIAERKIALRIVKMIKKSIELKVRGIQKAFRAYLYRPLFIKEQKPGQPALTNSEAQGAINIYKALNAWALSKKRTVMKKVPGVLNKFFEDLLVQVEISNAIEKYSEKVQLVQNKWKKRKQLTNAKLDMFINYWEKYCLDLVMQEKNKVKKQSTQLLIAQISEDHIRKHGQNFLRNKTKAIIRATNVFITMQAFLPSRNVKEAPKEPVEEKKEPIEETKEQSPQNNPLLRLPTKGFIRAEGVRAEKPKQDLGDIMHVVNVKPTSDELKTIFDQIIAELKQEGKM